jgi:hypothetical protein
MVMAATATKNERVIASSINGRYKRAPLVQGALLISIEFRQMNRQQICQRS